MSISAPELQYSDSINFILKSFLNQNKKVPHVSRDARPVELSCFVLIKNDFNIKRTGFFQNLKSGMPSDSLNGKSGRQVRTLVLWGS